MKDIDIPISEIEHLITEWINSKRDRDILRSRHEDGMTMEQLSEKYNLSVPRIKSIVYKGTKIIRKHYPKK